MLYDVFVVADDDSQWGAGWLETVDAPNHTTAKEIAIERIRKAIEQPEAELSAAARVI